MGENGSGKSTLLEAMAVSYGLNPEGGSQNYSFATFDSHSELYNAITLVKGYRRATWAYFLRAESFYNVATKALDYNIYDTLHQQSHGEGFMSIMSSFAGEGLIFLDEPEAALSTQRQLTLLVEMHRCVQEGAQFIVATHFPILLGYPGAEILSFDHGRIHPCRYEDTDSYQITKAFLTHRQGMLRVMFEEEND